MGEVAESGQEVLNQAFDLDVAVGNGISPADIKRLKDFGIATLEMVLMYTKKDLEKVKGEVIYYLLKLTPIWGISGTSGSVVSGQKIQRDLLCTDLGIF